jgi:hypothetical protein
MTVLLGGDKQIGQSKSSPSSTNEASFFNSSGFLDTSASKRKKRGKHVLKHQKIITIQSHIN